jgi:hypothetical protein
MLSESTPLRSEMVKIMDAEETPVSFVWSLEFKVKDSFKEEFKLTEEDKIYLDKDELDEKIFKPLKVVNIDFNNDYEKSVMREIWARVVIPFGMWAKCLFIARDHLTCIVRRVALTQQTFDKVENADVEEFIYDTLFHIDESNSLAGVQYNTISRTDLDNNYPPVQVNTELLERAVEKIRKITVGAPYRNVKPEDVIKNVLAHFTEDVEIEGEKAINIISVVEAHNKEKRDHIVIPQGMPLLDVPNYIQDNCGGVYNSSLNCFCIGDKIFVYPIYQTDRFEDEKKTLTVIKLPKEFMPQVERTFRKDGEALFVLGLSDSLYKDISFAKKLNEGNGVRHADSRKFLNKFVENKDNKTKVKRKENNSEYKSEDLLDQDFVTLSNKKINSNPFRERSKLAVRSGGTYTFQWPNSQPELLYPGMPARVLYEEDGEIMELRGVILTDHTSVAMIGQGLASDKHGTTTVINLFALPYKEKES